MITYYPVTDNYAQVLAELEKIAEPKEIKFELTEFVVYTDEDLTPLQLASE